MKEKGLNRNQIKYLAILAMLLDHTAWMCLPLASVPGQAVHLAGRLAMPVMAYFIAEGYRHTGNVSRYARRLGLFAVLSWVPFVYYKYGTFPIILHEHSIQILPYFGAVYTLFLGLLAIWFYDRCVCPSWCRGLGIVLLCLVSELGDWPVFGVLFCLIFYIYYGRPRKMWLLYCGTGILFLLCADNNCIWIENTYMMGIFVVPFLIQLCYNGSQGSGRTVHKWFFYWFYPVHLLVLGAVRQFVL